MKILKVTIMVEVNEERVFEKKEVLGLYYKVKRLREYAELELI